MTEAESELVEEARQSISAAELLLREEYPGYSAARAWYASGSPCSARSAATFCPSHAIQAGTPPENIVAMFDEAAHPSCGS